eukprot:1372168-Amphidinium_carterae.1
MLRHKQTCDHVAPWNRGIEYTHRMISQVRRRCYESTARDRVHKIQPFSLMQEHTKTTNFAGKVPDAPLITSGPRKVLLTAP